jgi:hypothetical protein
VFNIEGDRREAKTLLVTYLTAKYWENIEGAIPPRFPPMTDTKYCILLYADIIASYMAGMTCTVLSIV